MTNTPNINNKFYSRGRLVRDPNYSRKDGAGASAIFFTVACSRPFVNAAGDTIAATDYVEVKIFNTDIVARLESGGINKGAMVVVNGRAGAEVDTYEKEGKDVTRVRLVSFVEAGGDHDVTIEALGKSSDDTE